MRWYEQLSEGSRAVVVALGRKLQNESVSQGHGGSYSSSLLTVDSSSAPARWKEVHGSQRPWIALAYLTLREELRMAEEPPKE